MNYKIAILSALFFYSCALPVKTTLIQNNGSTAKYDQKYNKNLVIYIPSDEIKYEYEIIARIEVENDAVWGDINFDKKIKKYLLDSVNDIGADALIYDEEVSNKSYTYFDVILFNLNTLENNSIFTAPTTNNEE